MTEATAQAPVQAEEVVAAPGPRAQKPSTATGQAEAAPLVEEDLLVEDVSIDGMCGVY